jgi:UDP-glucose 4-epimerase
MKHNKWFIVGGAGFIGSHFVDALLLNKQTEQVTIYDNFSSGREWHYEHHLKDARLNIINANVEQTPYLADVMKGHDAVIHLASNPDIAKAATEPDIDFWQGTVLTNSVVEAMRRSGVNRLLYASGSGVYGDIGEEEAQEDRGPLLPVSTYGASKLAGEVLINSYCYMFGLTACMFRFGNVVGPRQTHGVGFDFAKKLVNDPSQLTIMGDGTQSKSYIHVYDIIRAVLLANKKLKKSCQVYNVATGDYINVQEISNLVTECMKLNDVKIKYLGGDRGWKGDVPIVRLNTNRIKELEWKCELSTREALKASILSMLPDIKNGKI